MKEKTTWHKTGQENPSRIGKNTWRRMIKEWKEGKSQEKQKNQVKTYD